MPSTFTPVIQLEKPGDGEQAGFWGSTVNANMDRLEAAVLSSLAMNGGAPITATPPAGTRRITEPASGEIIVQEFNGTTWVVLFDSRTKQAGGTSFLPLAGGTMTGAVVLAGNATASLNPTTLQQMQAADAATLASANAYADSVIGSGGIPPGTITMFGGSVAPAGWLLCRGQAVSRTTYAALFAAIGINYGGGDGVTTFNVPDMRGEFPRGHDAGRGVDPGRTLGTAQADALQDMNGYFGVDDRAYNSVLNAVPASASGVFKAVQPISPPNEAFTAGMPVMDTTSSGGDGLALYLKFEASRVARTAAETRPRNVAFNFIIRI